ncbi:MAG: sulfatase-like hydrolase/transferase [Maricaulaceae bacterium]
MMRHKLRYILTAVMPVVLLAACGPKEASDAAVMPTVQAVSKVAFSPKTDAGAPNVIIMVADDLGWADLSLRGSDIETPNIDSLAHDGLTLERFYSMPICTPTRSALMTARDPMKLGTIYAGFQPWQNGGVSPEEHFMPESFQAAGYQTAMIGKWHLGHTIQPLVPNSRGFEHFFGHLNTQIDFYDYTVARGYDLQENGKSVKRPGTYATDVHAEESVRYLTEIRDPEKPFFMYVPFLAPHAPMQAPAELEEKYKHRGNKMKKSRTYAAMVDSLDQAVGRILRTLEDQGLAENTIILFFSDNGGLEDFGSDNGPFRGGKLQTFEGGVRVGAFMRWPNKIAPGTTTDDVVSVLDVFPTLAKAADVPMGNTKKLDGKMRWDGLENGVTDKRGDDLYFASNSPLFNRYHLAVIEEKWKLVQIIDHQSQDTVVENFLFDLPNDKGEEKNLAETHPDQVKRLAKKIVKWRSQHPINGVRVALAPHPGWRAPLDYADSVIPSSTIQDDGYDTYVSGMRAKILQRMHGEKGQISYD